MRHKPKKCKEMVVNFMGNLNTVMKPLYIGNQIVERISSYKLLGVIINENLKWHCDVDYITAKASKKLYTYRLLKRAGVQEQDMLKVFRSSVRPILEYAVGVWKDIPDYLSDRIQSFQKRALKIIYPDSSYSQALSLDNETTLSTRREFLCHKFMSEVIDTHDHPLSCLVSTAVQRTNPYNLRPGSSRSFSKFIDQRYSSCKYPS